MEGDFVEYFFINQRVGDSEMKVYRKYLVLVIYDIIDNRRRRKFYKFLNSYGVRVQKSAFECVLDNRRYNKLLSSIDKYISSEDFVRVYKLYGDTDINVWGPIEKTKMHDVIIV